MTAIKLVSTKKNARQLSLFGYENEEKWDNVNKTIDSLKQKYGEQAYPTRDNLFISKKQNLGKSLFKKERNI